MPRVLRRLLFLALAAPIALVLLGFGAHLLLPASPEALHYSVTRGVGGPPGLGPAGCRERGDDRWRCDVLDTQGSGSLEYAVRMDGRRCWRARRLSPPGGEEGEPLPGRAKGCVGVRDRLRFNDRI
ncbi:MAG: hypothetical protein ACR2ML_00760 [Solirubrobacteraceae bacterium]